MKGNKSHRTNKIIPILLVIVILIAVAVVGALVTYKVDSPAKPQIENHTVATEPSSFPSSKAEEMAELRTEATTAPWTEVTTAPRTEAATETSITLVPTQAHTHSWQAITCTDPKICRVCGETDGTPLGHDWMPATCSSPCTCRVCGATEGNALGHNWMPATCSSAAMCRNCGITEGTALEHIWMPATRSAPKTCVNCGITEGDSLPSAVYLNEMPYSSKYGKLWTRSETPLGVTAHTKADHPSCWSDMNTPGHTLGPVLDCRGNAYKYGLHLDGDDTATYYISYNLDGMYTTFSGTCAYPGEVISTQWAPKYTKCFYVYADGELLYTSSQMNKDTAPVSFSRDVTGVKELRIVYPASDGPNEVATLFDGKLE